MCFGVLGKHDGVQATAFPWWLAWFVRPGIAAVRPALHGSCRGSIQAGLYLTAGFLLLTFLCISSILYVLKSVNAIVCQNIAQTCITLWHNATHIERHMTQLAALRTFSDVNWRLHYGLCVISKIYKPSPILNLASLSLSPTSWVFVFPDLICLVWRSYSTVAIGVLAS